MDSVHPAMWPSRLITETGSLLVRAQIIAECSPHRAGIFQPLLDRAGMPLGMWADLWAFCLVPLVYISVFALAPYSVSREVPRSVLKCEMVLAPLMRPLKFPETPDSLEWNTEGPGTKGMEIHSSILTWRIPWMEKPGRLQCREPRCSPRVRPVCRGTFEGASRVPIPFRTSRRNVGLQIGRASCRERV